MTDTENDVAVQEPAVDKPKSGLPELIAGVLVVALGLMMVIGAESIAESRHIVQSSFFPRLTGYSLIICGGYLTFRGFIGWRRTVAETIEAANGKTAPLSPESVDAIEAPVPENTTGNTKRLIVIIGMLGLYAMLVIPVGYIITTFAFLFVASSYIDRTHLLRNGLFSAIFTGAVYLLFNNLMRVILPSGLLEGLL